jgi:S-adenosylmethionine-dependent methyltransferase
MKETTANDDLERFRTGVAKFAAYLETPEGKLRLNLAFANLQEFLPRITQPLHALDLGCGTGAMALRLAQLGLRVTLLDASAPMLEFAERTMQEAGFEKRVELKHGDATQLAGLFPGESFDVILCHNVLEYLEDPNAVLRNAARALRGPSSIISVLVRNQAGDVLKAAIQDGDLTAADHNLTAEWGHESLYGGPVRLFTTERLNAMLRESSLSIAAQRGIRVLSDYLPPKVSRSDEYRQILELERKLGRRPEFAGVARYTHCLAHHKPPVTKGAA